MHLPSVLILMSPPLHLRGGSQRHEFSQSVPIIIPMSKITTNFKGNLRQVALKYIRFSFVKSEKLDGNKIIDSGRFCRTKCI